MFFNKEFIVKNYEIERKFLPANDKEILSIIKDLPYKSMIQAYLNLKPVVRVRKEDDEYYLTYKGEGSIAKEEYNLKLNEESFYNLLKKCEGNIIEKQRYNLRLTDKLVAEVDVFRGKFEGLILIEVEFESIEDAENFVLPDWFGRDVSYEKEYHNAYMSTLA